MLRQQSLTGVWWKPSEGLEERRFEVLVGGSRVSLRTVDLGIGLRLVGEKGLEPTTRSTQSYASTN